MPPTPSELRAAANKPFFNKLIMVLGFLVFILGVAGTVGHYFRNWFLLTIIPFGKPIALATAYTLIFVGLGIKTILNSHPYHEKSVWLWPIRYLGWIVPLAVAVYWLYYYLNHPGFDLLDMGSYGTGTLTFLTAVILGLSGVALSAFLFGQRSEAVVSYIVSALGLFIFNIGILTSMGYFYKLPFLYSFKMAFPASLSAIFTGIALLFGTIPFRGLMLPLLSDFRNVRLLGWISLILGIGITLFALNSIALSLRYSHAMYTELSVDLRHIYTGALMASSVLGIILSMLGLRASRYLSKAQFFAHEQLRLLGQENLKRRLLEIIRSSLDLQTTLQTLATTIGEHFHANSCLIAVYDKNDSNHIAHLQQYVSPICNIVDKEDIPTHTTILKNTLIQFMQPNALLILNSKTDFPDFFKPYAEKYGIQSSVDFDFLYQEHSYGRLMLNQCDKARSWTKDELALLQDITQSVTIAIRQAEIAAEERETLQALERSEQRFRMLMDGVPDYSIYLEDVNGIINSWNKGAERLYGYRAEEIIGKPISTFFTQAEKESGLLELELETAAREGRFEIDSKRIRKDGSQFWANVILSAIRDAEGHLIGYSSITRDITERKKAEEALREYQARLAESNRDLESFAAIASHDLQAPLRKVRSFMDMVYEDSKDKLDSGTLNLIERSKKALDDAQTMIKDLLALSQVSKRERLRKIELSKVIDRVLTNLDPEIREKQARITVNATDSLFADETQLEQLIQNLVDNALKYQPPGQEPEIHIESSCLDHVYCQFTVSDNGIGIPPQAVDRIFEPFERLHGKTSLYAGTGMGLAICKRIVERHGGSIRVESEVGKGTRFIVRLPCHAPAVKDSLSSSQVYSE
jgi:PAS domain S-box-containing protein